MSTRVAPHVAWLLDEKDPGLCLIARVPDHRPLRLEKTATSLWLCWAEDGMTLGESVEAMAAAYQVAAEEVRPRAAELFHQLVDEGYLLPSPEDA